MANATYVGAFASDSGPSAATSVSVTLTGVQEGDLVLAAVCIERATATAGTPVTTAGSTFTVDDAGADTTMAWSFAHHVLLDGDAPGGSCTITSTVSGGLTRRCAIDAVVFRGTTSVDFVGGAYTENGTGVVTATAPSITPGEDDCTLVSLFASVSNVAPYQRTRSIDAPYAIAGDDGSTSTSATNAYATGATQGLTGGDGVSQDGATLNDTTTPTPTKFAWIAGTYAVGALAYLPWVFVDSISGADPGELSTIQIEGTDPLGLTDDLAFALTGAADGTAATYEVLVDWTGTGGFAGVGDDITDRVLGARHTVTTQRGRNQPARTVDDISPGEAQFALNNVSRDYSPDNGGSPLAGLVGPGREILIRATLGTHTYPLYRGRLDGYTVRPSVSDRSVELTCMDGLGQLAQTTISTPLHQGVTTGRAVGYVLDAAGWPTDRRDIDPGHTAIAWWWEEGATALDALRRLVRAEGPPALAAVDGDGYLVFRDRTHRHTRTRSRYSQAVFAAGSDEEPQALDAGFVYDAGWSSIVNRVEVTVQTRACTGIPQQVWSTDTPVSLADGETVRLVATSTDPFLGAVTPVSGTDFVTSSGGGVTCSLDRDSGAAVTISVTATSGAVTVLSMGLRACPVPVTATTRITAEDPASISEHGVRAYTRDIPWVGVNDAQAIAHIITTHYADRLSVVTFRVSGNVSRMLEQLSRELSDQITVSEDESGVNSSFFIERISHEIAAGPSHVTTFTCEQAPAQVTNPFRFDIVGAGFNQGMFAKEATVVTPLFTFDVEGQGFDDGLFAN